MASAVFFWTIKRYITLESKISSLGMFSGDFKYEFDVHHAHIKIVEQPSTYELYIDGFKFRNLYFKDRKQKKQKLIKRKKSRFIDESILNKVSSPASELEVGASEREKKNPFEEKSVIGRLIRKRKRYYYTVRLITILIRL